MLELFETQSVLEHVRETAPYLEKCLDQLKDRYDCILERRGLGLMQGLVFDRPVGEIIDRALEEGLLLINAGQNVIRFLPSLVISKANIDEMADILDSCLEQVCTQGDPDGQA